MPPLAPGSRATAGSEDLDPSLPGLDSLRDALCLSFPSCTSVLGSQARGGAAETGLLVDVPALNPCQRRRREESLKEATAMLLPITMASGPCHTCPEAAGLGCWQGRVRGAGGERLP